MKKIYAIYLSEDGLFYQAYSNKKALFNAIINGLQNYEHCRTIETYVRKNGDFKCVDKTFTYANLVKDLNVSDSCILSDGKGGYGTIRIETLELVSK